MPSRCSFSNLRNTLSATLLTALPLPREESLWRDCLGLVDELWKSSRQERMYSTQWNPVKRLVNEFFRSNSRIGGSAGTRGLARTFFVTPTHLRRSRIPS